MSRLILALTVCLVFAGAASATITDLTSADDGDGAVVCSSTWWQSGFGTVPEYNLLVVGNQYWGPGHILGDIFTDTALDPIVTVDLVLDNDTSFDWTGFSVDVSMDSPFTLSAAAVNSPTDWTAAISQQPVLGGDNRYHGLISYTGATPVATTESLDFRYTMAFSGSTSYSYCQMLTPLADPVPEPLTIACVAMGLGSIGAYIRRRLSA